MLTEAHANNQAAPAACPNLVSRTLILAVIVSSFHGRFDAILSAGRRAGTRNNAFAFIDQLNGLRAR